MLSEPPKDRKQRAKCFQEAKHNSEMLGFATKNLLLQNLQKDCGGANILSEWPRNPRKEEIGRLELKKFPGGAAPDPRGASPSTRTFFQLEYLVFFFRQLGQDWATSRLC